LKLNNNYYNNSIVYYLCAESIAKRAITDTAQCRNRKLHYRQKQHKDKTNYRQALVEDNNSIQFNSIQFYLRARLTAQRKITKRDRV
jgi:hypothetical protein